jgi:CHASE2 domain-containing sensor protein
MRPFSLAWFAAERAKQPTRWHVWPLTLMLGAVGFACLVRFLYLGWWSSAVFAVLWLVGLTVIGGPSRLAWNQRHESRRRS